MRRHTNPNYARPGVPPNDPMFGHYLSGVGSQSARAVANWRHWYQPGPLLCLQHPPFPISAVRPASQRPPRPQNPYNWSSWRQTVNPPHAPSTRGLMDSSDREPPQKKKRDGEERPPGDHAPRKSSRDRFHRSNVSPPSSPRRRPATPELKRHWEDFSPGERNQRSPFDFSVMSYNILSQELLLDNSYLYRHCNPPVLDTQYRLANIIRELQKHSADIMCLQEVQEDHYIQQIKPALQSLGYQCEYKRRTGLKPDGCAVIFNRQRFSMVSRHPVEYYRRDVPLLNRDNVGLILLLRPVDPSASVRDICVANTHLLYNPRRGDVKLAQLAVLLAEISRVAQLPDGGACPVLLCGDFNSVPWSPLYRFVRESRLDYDGIPIGQVSGQEENPRGQRILNVPIWPRNLGISQQCQYESTTTVSSSDSDTNDSDQMEERNGHLTASIEHGLRLTSAYSHRLKESGQPEITTCHSRTAITVDYIFYSAAPAECTVSPESGLHLLGRLALVGEDELQEVNGLPNQHHSSDHLPLLTRFRLQSQSDG